MVKLKGRFWLSTFKTQRVNARKIQKVNFVQLLHTKKDPKPTDVIEGLIGHAIPTWLKEGCIKHSFINL